MTSQHRELRTHPPPSPPPRHNATVLPQLHRSILSHSVLIGLDMGVSGGGTFIALLIAISFHQFFEGFALAQVVLEAEFKT